MLPSDGTSIWQNKKWRNALNDARKIAHDEWLKTPEIRPNIELDAFIIMPNHMHGIILISRTGELHSPHDGHGHSPNNSGECDSHNNHHELHSPHDGHGHSPNNRGECDSPLPDSPLRGPTQTIGAIIRGYKSSATKQINALNRADELPSLNDGRRHSPNDKNFSSNIDEFNSKGKFNSPRQLPPKIWQRNYYEHIIRDEQSYQRIAAYINKNPTKWDEDKFNRK